MAALQRRLDEFDKSDALAYVSAALTEAEKEKQHQEDLQRLRGFRLIDDDFMNKTVPMSSMTYRRDCYDDSTGSHSYDQ